MQPIIRVEDLSKQYRIGARQEGYRTLRESLSSAVARPWRRLKDHWTRRVAGNGQADIHRPGLTDSFWALKDVSFDVQPGEVVGIIGRNGAGKSTLLKILSRITEPTDGRVSLRGRVNSLLEVGTGFHPELTGRENIYLCGAILGMTRQEIRRKFDEIVAFAGIEEFLDTPAKRYSSGMYVRLAFAVAAHLEPEILIVDEVLAVGDMAFQSKCLGKMGEVGRSGRTILFVSHNMPAVEGLCRRAIVLDRGQIHCDTNARKAIESYYDLARNALTRDGERFVHEHRNGSPDHFRIQEVWITSNGESDPVGFPTGAELEFHVRCSAPRAVPRPMVSFHIIKLGAGPVTMLHSQRTGKFAPASVEGNFVATCTAGDLRLAPGDYMVRVWTKSGEELVQLIEDAAHFSIRPTDYFGSGYAPDPSAGCVVCHQTWKFQICV
jgi:lipopolysaccharide transport system ATP-binding protein